MNLIIHLLKKDIRRSRGLLIAWLLLLIVQGVLVSSGVNPGDRVMQELYAMISSVVPFFEALLIIVIVPSIVQEEPLVGTTAFWLTRPISRRTLLGEKALFGAAVLVLPALIAQLVVLAANGITAPDIALAVPEVLLGQIELVVMVGLVAALTPTFGKYAIVGAAAVTTMLVATLAIQWARMFSDPESLMQRVQDISLGKSNGVATGVASIIVCTAVVTHQYLSRRTVRSIVAACAGVAAVIAIQYYWKWDFLALRIPTKAAPAFEISATEPEGGSSVFANDVAMVRGQSPPLKQISARLKLIGLPSNYLLEAKRIQPHLKVLGGADLDATEPRYLQQSTWSNTKALVAALGGTPIVNPQTRNGYTSLFVLDAGTYRKYYDQPLTYSANIDFQALEYKIVMEMPVAKGARYRAGSRHSVITEVLRQPDGVDIVLREWGPNLLFDRSNSFMLEIDPGYRRIYALLNKKRNQAVLQRNDNSNMFIEMQFGQSRLINHPVRLSFGSEPNFKRTVPHLTPEWLAEAELVRLDLTPKFEFSKHLVLENFKMDANDSKESR